jgi:hypothetical protein
VHVCFSSPSPEDQIGVTYDSKGRVDISLVTALLPPGDYDFYLCGPSEFMNSLYSGLVELAFVPERIHYESFGPGTVLKPELPRKPSEAIAQVRCPREIFPLRDRDGMVSRRWHFARACGRSWARSRFRLPFGHLRHMQNSDYSAARSTIWTNRWPTAAKGRSCSAAPCLSRAVLRGFFCQEKLGPVNRQSGNRAF